ncbi:LLM class flavin-dependent oxidoreductase [Nocardia sp. NPDC051570]|uniref:LLM class flavin-dependent oxidoreductase n=1 Tax=Nocardia sp. NPDC051570 TaxID=3364324 RepID=UPI0037A13DEE
MGGNPSSSSEATISTLMPLQPIDLGSTLPYARLAARTRSQRLWCGQSLNIETHQIFAALAASGLGLQFGSSVTLTPLLHPAHAVVHARSVAALSGTTYISGYGPGAKIFQRVTRGAPYPSALAAMEQYLTIMRALLTEEVLDITDGEWACAGMELPPLDRPPVEIGLGVLRTGMAELAGRHADWAITWLTPATYIRDTLLPAMTAAADDAGRPVPRVAAVVHCALAAPGRDLAEMAFHSAGRHLSAPHYTDMLRQAGLDVHRSDPRAGAQALLDAGVFVTGSADDVAAEIHRYHQAGVTDVIVNVFGVQLTHGTGAALADLSAIMSAAEQDKP